MSLLKRRRSIYDLQAAKPEKLEDLTALVRGFSLQRLNPVTVNRTVAQFIAVRTCLRMPLP